MIFFHVFFNLFPVFPIMFSRPFSELSFVFLIILRPHFLLAGKTYRRRWRNSHYPPCYFCFAVRAFMDIFYHLAISLSFFINLLLCILILLFVGFIKGAGEACGGDCPYRRPVRSSDAIMDRRIFLTIPFSDNKFRFYWIFFWLLKFSP